MKKTLKDLLRENHLQPSPLSSIGEEVSDLLDRVKNLKKGEDASWAIDHLYGIAQKLNDLDTLDKSVGSTKTKNMDKFYEMPSDPDEMKKKLKKMKKTSDPKVVKSENNGTFLIEFGDDWSKEDQDLFFASIQGKVEGIKKSEQVKKTVTSFLSNLNKTYDVLEVMYDRLAKGESLLVGTVEQNGPSDRDDADSKKKAKLENKEIKMFQRALKSLVSDIKGQKEDTHLEKAKKGKSKALPTQAQTIASVRSGGHKPTRAEAPKKGKGSKYNRAQQKESLRNEG